MIVREEQDNVTMCGGAAPEVRVSTPAGTC